MKPKPQDSQLRQHQIAPFTGARIETMNRQIDSCAAHGSPPSRGRGLKRPSCGLRGKRSGSPPSRGRGLKHHRRRIVCCSKWIAPFTGARIETYSYPNDQRRPEIAPFTGARIETSTGIWTKVSKLIAPFTGARIETLRNRWTLDRHRDRPLHGGAD